VDFIDWLCKVISYIAVVFNCLLLEEPYGLWFDRFDSRFRKMVKQESFS
jgi:hypothetical protein